MKLREKTGVPGEKTLKLEEGIESALFAQWHLVPEPIAIAISLVAKCPVLTSFFTYQMKNCLPAVNKLSVVK